MSIKNFTAQNAINYIDGTLIKQRSFSRIDKSNRSKAHFFEVGKGGKQFGVVVGDADKKSGVFSALQTRVLLEEFPSEILDVEAMPIENYWNASPVKRSYSRLMPPNQRSVLVRSEEGLRRLLEWYTGSHGITQVHAINETTDKNHDDQNLQFGDKKKQSIGVKVDPQMKSLGDQLNEESDRIGVAYANKPGEDIDSIVKRRLGQGPFRNLLMKKYGGACCLSGLSESRLLIASHIVPWSESSGEQKTDHENGLLLSVSWDALFDKGLVSFNDEGILLRSESFSETAKQLGVSINACLPTTLLTEQRKKYLAWHRQKHGFES